MKTMRNMQKWDKNVLNEINQPRSSNFQFFQTIKMKAVAKKMLSFISSRQFKLLEEKHFKLIGDNCSAQFLNINENNQ